jgi:proton glutamate symport protein
MRARRVVVGLIAGLIIGSAIGAQQGPIALRLVSIIEPIGQLWVSAIRMTVVPLVISLLFVGVAGHDATERLGRIGAITLVTFVALLAFAGIVALLLAPHLMADMKLSADAVANLRAAAGAGAVKTTAQAAQVPGFASWVTSLVPANVVKAAADGAMLPIIVFTLLFALATRHIEAALRGSLLHFFGAVAGAVTTVVDWIIWAAPVGIFALVVVAASRAGLGLAGAMAYYIIAISALLALFALLMYPIAAMVGRVPLGWFTRAAVPPQAVALSSSSSLASLPALVESARALGLPTTVSGFVLPLSVSTFKVATPITWMMGILFLARLYGVELPTSALVSIAVTAAALSLTLPGVPQGALLLLTPVLTSYGIPAEGVGLLLAVDTIPDLMGTMTNVTGDLVVGTVVGCWGVAEPALEAASSADA